VNPSDGTVVAAPGFVNQSGKLPVSRCTCRRGQVGGQIKQGEEEVVREVLERESNDEAREK
jgi:hypothetical protein